jgi:hypothetical protein
MRDVLKSSRRWLHAGWVLPLVLLALPNCMLNSEGYGVGDDHFDPGSEPRTEAIMCDIPVVQNPNISECATGTEVGFGIPLMSAATALAQNQGNSLGLDFSQSAVGQCGGPKRVEFHGRFPDGLTVCVNCGQALTKYVDAHAVCVAKCVDLTDQGEFEAPGGTQAFCEANAKVSTNVTQVCFTNACSNGGTPILPFDDPRRPQEPVKWTGLVGTAVADQNNVSKVGGLDNGTLESGATSVQTITHGDAWIEFQAAEDDRSHVLGIKTDNGTGTATDLSDIAFALSLNNDGHVYVLENGATYVSSSFGEYDPGQRFRVKIKDNNDGTASISYWRLNGPCAVGTECSETQLATQTEPSPSYPLLIRAQFREPDATLANVTMVYIRQP